MGTILPVKADGDVPIPPDVRTRLHWNGSNVSMEEVGDAVILRREHVDRQHSSASFDWAEFRRHVPRWQGRRGASDDWSTAVERMFTERGSP